MHRYTNTVASTILGSFSTEKMILVSVCISEALCPITILANVYSLVNITARILSSAFK